MTAKLTQLIPFDELTVGQVGAIRNSVTNSLLLMAAKELSMPLANLVARDLRPQSDLDWASDDNATNGLVNNGTPVTTELWRFRSSDDIGAAVWGSCITPNSQVMADQRFVAIYGIKNARMTIAAPLGQTITLWKIVVGNSTKCIWDSEKLNAYRNNVAGITSSAVIIPQNTQWNIWGYLPAASDVLQEFSLEGVVVEPRGKVVSP